MVYTHNFKADPVLNNQVEDYTTERESLTLSIPQWPVVLHMGYNMIVADMPTAMNMSSPIPHCLKTEFRSLNSFSYPGSFHKYFGCHSYQYSTLTLYTRDGYRGSHFAAQDSD